MTLVTGVALALASAQRLVQVLAKTQVTMRDVAFAAGRPLAMPAQQTFVLQPATWPHLSSAYHLRFELHTLTELRNGGNRINHNRWDEILNVWLCVVL